MVQAQFETHCVPFLRAAFVSTLLYHTFRISQATKDKNLILFAKKSSNPKKRNSFTVQFGRSWIERADRLVIMFIDRAKEHVQKERNGFRMIGVSYPGMGEGKEVIR